MTEHQMAEIKRYVGVGVDGLRNDTRQVAEGRDRDPPREEAIQFKEVRSLIKFSYAELDQAFLLRCAVGSAFRSVFS